MTSIAARWLMLPVLFAALFLHGCGSLPVAPQAEPVPTPQPRPEALGTTAPTKEAAAPAIEPSQQRITVAAVGDIMLGSDFPDDALPPHDGKEMLTAAAPLLRSADIALGNLEGVLLDGGKPFKQCQNNGRCYVFRSPSRYAQLLAESGFDVLSLANNHARDFGEAGRSASMTHLDAVGIRHSGRVGDVASWSVAGRRVAFIAFAPYDGSHDLREIAQMKRLVAQLASDHDIVIVSFHGGSEGSDAVNVPFASEYYHGEDRGDVAHFARAAVEAGADLVIGHGPHVPRGIELYQERLIAYSLGNFATYQGVNVAGRTGLAPLVTVTLDGEGRFISGDIHSFRQQRPGGPQPDPSVAAARLMAQVTASNFADSPLKIDEGGTLLRIDGALAVGKPGSTGKIPPARVE
ncbi:MAG TPA: CapA family protein [Gammaproteobacteria bacterium]